MKFDGLSLGGAFALLVLFAVILAAVGAITFSPLLNLACIGLLALALIVGGFVRTA